MLGAVSPMRGLFKARTVKTDNVVFRLHYQVTTLIFLSASVILVSNQLFGQAIDCFTHHSESTEGGWRETVNNFCWVTSTFTVKEHLCANLGSHAPYAGIGTLTSSSGPNTPFNVSITYRFLFFVLFLQGVSFFLPHYIWKSWESRKMGMLSQGLENPLLDDRQKSATIQSLSYYLLHGQQNGSIQYSIRMHLCETMNFIILGGNILFTDFLFRHEFLGYGIKALGEMFKGSNYFDTGCLDPIKFLFPQVAQCSMRSFGPSGNVMNREHLCVLPLNDFNSVFFKFTWIWFAILLFCSVFWLLMRVAMFYSCRLRSFLLSRRAGRLPISSAHMHESGRNCCHKICSRISYADWVILMQLGCNMDPLTYKIFLEHFCRQTEIKESGKQPKHHIDKIYYSPV